MSRGHYFDKLVKSLSVSNEETLNYSTLICLLPLQKHSNECISLEPFLKDAKTVWVHSQCPLKSLLSLSFNFHLINFIKSADGAKLGGVRSSLENKLGIQKGLCSVGNHLK